MEELKNESLIEAINNLRKSKGKGWKEKNYCYARFIGALFNSRVYFPMKHETPIKLKNYIAEIDKDGENKIYDVCFTSIDEYEKYKADVKEIIPAKEYSFIKMLMEIEHSTERLDGIIIDPNGICETIELNELKGIFSYYQNAVDKIKQEREDKINSWFGEITKIYKGEGITQELLRKIVKPIGLLLKNTGDVILKVQLEDFFALLIIANLLDKGSINVDMISEQKKYPMEIKKLLNDYNDRLNDISLIKSKLSIIRYINSDDNLLETLVKNISMALLQYDINEQEEYNIVESNEENDIKCFIKLLSNTLISFPIQIVDGNNCIVEFSGEEYENKFVLAFTTNSEKEKWGDFDKYNEEVMTVKEYASILSNIGNYYIIINYFGNKLVVEDHFMKELLNQ